MKSTQERLSEVYCRPKTEEERAELKKWRSRVQLSSEINIAVYSDGRVHSVSEKSHWWREFGQSLTEIPVSHFIDLLRDTISPWRLEEDGFMSQDGVVYFKMLYFEDRITFWTSARRVTCHTELGVVSLNHGSTNVKTYSQLINLVELIG